ncbi:cache domain-containing protein [Halarcobacter ebronensis]|uniref:histidine kinase n=1 Tax=Halarcobacter ebronensis TaxID=1462615 RepID=A0A4Q1AQ15_9BACT|nr:cache domain-containing protein [Halarcobacter ebronensis]RXK06782.1 hypothetical protein CRV07_04955 [Halarcobacter ebronensis]
MMKEKSLNKQILHLLMLITISVIITVGTLSIINIYNSKKELINFNQSLVLKQVNTKINELINEIDDVSRYIKRNYGLDDKSSINNLLELKSFISSILVLNKDGTVENFYSKSVQQNVYKGFDYSNKEYYKKLKSTNVYWSNVFLSSVDETPTISYSFKMGNKIGVVLIDLSSLSTFVIKFKNQDGSHMIRVFDRNGIIIMNPDTKALISQRYDASSSEVFTELINKKSPDSHGVFKSNVSGEKQYGSYWQNSRTGWYLIVRNNYNEIMRPIYYIVVVFILLIIFFIALSIYFSFKISKKIFKSFDNLHTITSKIADGHYSLEHKDMYYDEFNKLLNSFSKMQEEIDKREDKLEQSLSSFKALFNSTMESIVLSSGYDIIDLNDVTVEIFGFESKEEAIGRNVLDFVSEDYKELVKERFKKNILEPYEVDFCRKDGTIINGLVQGKFLKLDGKNIRVSALIDISDVKSKDKLLFQQTKMASMGEMIGNIAHQWRQPLNVISTSASSIKLEKEFGILEDKQIDIAMDMIVQNALYLSKTIDDFRNFFRIDKSLEKFEIRDSIDKALKLLQASIKNHNLVIKTDFLDKKFEVEGYPNEFIQVIINLINNSKDAFIANDISPRIIEIRELVNRDSYKLKFSDNAGGIPDSILLKIFDPYFTTKHKSQGTGIGLYMSHQIIVDHMRGEFYVKNINYKVEDKNYKGCCFTIKLPKNISHSYTFEI